MYIFGSVEGGTPVLEELWDDNGPKRCAIVDLVPTGSYQATLGRVGLSYIGFEGFPFGLFFLSLWCLLVLAGTPCYSLVLLAAGTRCWYSPLVLAAGTFC
jgi:hypothetical protein